ncbi:ATP-dependent DNA helicase RecG [Corynebacterium lizhenjunii]|uniref:ATP-dependent DNA helicase RecG n=1 Tax=Corynebacterium lizhenjunii TaxID=2709394 RepID=UPI0013EC4D7D|nr:ATP-dependent DNA helicase RecG [Corynebacterium lizhenjunii]
MLGWQDNRALGDVLPQGAAKLLQQEFGYTTCGQLLEHYPRRYTRAGQDIGLAGAIEGDFVTLVGEVLRLSQGTTRRGLHLVTITITGGVKATFFGQQWVGKVIKEGMRILLAGTLSSFNGDPVLTQPKFVLLGSSARKMKGTKELRLLSQFGDIEQLLEFAHWIPVYPATDKASSWFLMGAIHYLLERTAPIAEPLDYELPLSFDAAVRQVHEPPEQGPYLAVHRLKYNEALTVGLVMALRKQQIASQQAPALPVRDDGYRAQLLEGLPFSLTTGQQQVVAEIVQDLEQSVPMQRLLQGEVGSGKTLVATVAMVQAVDAGKQAALLAPTEVLAAQHARSLAQGLPEGVRVVLLSGSLRVAQKRQALLDIVSGEADIVVGTHAMIQDSVEFYDLGLVVVDEQHRFGVEQRDSLRAKTRQGTQPHTLVMTATPIPRTIAMTVFGDLAVSTLAELPGGRKPISSHVVPGELVHWVDRCWQLVREHVAAGHQAYVVCPRIEGECGVLETAAALESGPLAGLRIAVLHGRLENKDDIMARFAAGEIDVLVSTTVIEVGVDVANATVMVIWESERFGASQLHQLRGRVGRGGHASVCLFHTTATPGSPSEQRVQAIAQTTSGFELAEIDLHYRREGDVLGILQSGTKRTLQLLNLGTDYETIARARRDAERIVAHDKALAHRLAAELSADKRSYLEKN